jgi:hypothetical protein
VKVGDLVKHPLFAQRSCPTTYSLGVVLKIEKSCFYGTGARVNWLRGRQTQYVYPTDELEVLHEGR